MLRVIRLCCLLALVAAPATAQLSAPYAHWGDGPERFLLTDAERAAWSKVTTDQEAVRFIDLFWAKRDPDLATRENAFRGDFEAKAAVADKQLGEGERRGALTDRGRVWLLLGKPSTTASYPLLPYLHDLYRDNPPDVASPLDRTLTWHGLTFDRDNGVVSVWEYTREQIPAAALPDKKEKKIVFVFVDPKGSGAFTHAAGIRYGKEASEVLAAVPATFVLHPELTELPLYPLLPGSQSATAEQLAWLGLQPAPWPQGAVAQAVQGVVLENDLPAWVFLRLPSAAPAADLAVGRLTRADKSVAGTFQIPISGQATTKGAVYELSVPAPPGTSTLELALAAAGKPVAVQRLELLLDPVAPGTTYIGPVLAGGEVKEVGQAGVGKPFVLGGYHLVLRPDGDYDWPETLSYFVLVIRPGVGAEGKPAVTMQERFKLGGKQAPAQQPRPANLLLVAPNVFMAASELPLGAFRQGGEYTLKVTVKDTVSNSERTVELPLHLPPKPASP